MGLYVKDAKMPKDCWTCPCYNKECLICQVTGSNCEDEKPDNCPLVELPSEHGRLVNCDALMEKEESDWFDKILADLLHKALEIILTEKNAPIELDPEE